jgi:6,7-dimethyl-8-ribityllumazine synthase
MAVGLKFSVPVIFGVLTDDTMQQAQDRSGGKHGNKGVDCAVALLKMAAFRSASAAH